MSRLIELCITVSLVVPLVGCGSGSKQLPPEYQILAESVAFDFKGSQDEFRELSRAEATAELQGYISALEGINSTDTEITSLAVHAKAAYHDLQKGMERIQSMPKPPGFASELVKGLLAGFYTGYTGDPSGILIALKSSLDANSNVDALVAELKGLSSSWDKIDANQMMLPRIAQKYAAKPSKPNGRILVDLDAAWGPYGPHDWLKLCNTGREDLENCTIQVQLTGDKGHSRKNLHFVRHWKANSWIYTRYDQGMQIPDCADLFRTTVSEPQKLEIAIWSPNFTTTLTYAYQGNEKDKDIAGWCRNLNLSGQNQPFVPGLLWNTERGAKFTLDGMQSIPNFHADVTFRKDSMSKTWSWDHEKWIKGETKSFIPPKGELTFDPIHVDVTISFPGTGYQHKAMLSSQ